MITITKSYRDYPAAHRQPGHDGHCRLIHGHAWGWDVVFQCDTLDPNGFVVDVGRLKGLKAWLDHHFDHTLLLNANDAAIVKDTAFCDKLAGVFAKVIVVPNCGMEGLAVFVFAGVNAYLSCEYASDVATRRLRVIEVTCWEDSKNKATYRP